MRRFVALALLFALAPPTFAQQPAKGPTIPFDGVDVFRYLLKQNGFRAVSDVKSLADLPAEETVVIVFGKTDQLRDVNAAVGSLDEFRRQGGNLLIASDYASAQLTSLGVDVSGRPVLQPPASAYRGNDACPRLTEFSPANPALFVPVGSLATNRPSYLVREPDSPLEPLADFPEGCVVHVGRSFGRELFLPFRLLKAHGRAHYAVGSPAAQGPRGRVLCLAGHGLFTNGMLLQRDNDNFLFAHNVLQWLREGPDGQRRHALFLVDGQPVASFDASLKPPLPPIPMPTVKVVNQLLRGLEDERFFHRLIEDNLDLPLIVRVVLLAVSVVALAYGAKKLAEQRYFADTSVPLLVGPYALPPDPLPWVEQRHRAQVAGNHYGEQAVALARQWFLENVGDDSLPAFEVAGPWWQRWRLARRAEEVRQLAQQSTPPRYTWRQLVGLLHSLQELSAAVRAGRLRLLPA